ncbi:HutD family protein [Pseudomonas cichorii]|nr:HutD family protein [Pseudomonas cichorii]MBX8493063.1 HutD family protein [Pseudomonas cichorii]MBX8522928.1 HutD family protein [Pseudomonas cichorii]MBX8552431.1 HutD family protein [Pseudomonas cichorii]MBX8572593.1 HutD family protein [Pseudomonas cichorii]MBX8587275.1 HutD family protein [Pseudomonas cichorii]
MTLTKTLRAIDYPRMPWKNGGGSTEEITRDAGQDLDGFGWRLSIADIETSGDFSVFAGYQRIISVIQGAGMTLDIDGVTSRPLLPSDPLAFSGDSQVSCALLDGPIRDFNLIYAPQRYSARLHWIDVRQPQRIFSSASTFLLFSVAEQIGVSVNEGPWEILGKHDCLQVDNPGSLLEIELQAPSASRCCLIELSALGA